LDVDGSGLVNLEVLRRPKKYSDPFLLRDITPAFQQYNPKHNEKAISFSEFLDVLYADLTDQQRKLMHSWVPKPINKEMVKDIQRTFDRLDTDFTGKVKMWKIVKALSKNEQYKSYIEPYQRLRPNKLDVAISIRELLQALFKKTHSRDMKKILGWAKPSKLLNEIQQTELFHLFSTYDKNNDGTIELHELRQRLRNRGLTLSEINSMFSDVDVNDDGRISLQEFQIFYRDIWDTYVNFDIDCSRYNFDHRSNGGGLAHGFHEMTDDERHAIMHNAQTHNNKDQDQP